MASPSGTPSSPERPSLSWSEIVAAGQKLKVPTINRRQLNNEDRQNFENTVIYECEDLAVQMRIHRAETILQQALNYGAVLFELPRAELEDYISGYKLISKQLGRLLGVRNIDNGRLNRQQYYLIEATFATSESFEEAITHGVTIKGIQYRGTPTQSGNGDIPEMVRVNLTGFPFAEEDEIRESILKSMNIYGRICQIRLTKNSGFFEGNLSVLMDVQERKEQREPLQRMLYLSEWNKYIPASFRGAPPICYHCRQSNHLKANCPVLADIKCFACHEKGHLARNCPGGTPPKPTINGEDLDKLAKETRQLPTSAKGKENEQEPQTAQETTVERDQVTVMETEAEEANSASDDMEVSILDDSPDTPVKGSHTSGLTESQHAPMNIRSTMSVDTVKEMLSLTATSTKKRQSRITKIPLQKTGERDEVVPTKTRRLEHRKEDSRRDAPSPSMSS
jgi:hypothetical protein